MNRSVERRRLPASGVPAGEVWVTTGFRHPRRGLVRCPAAPAVATSLRRQGLRVREGSVPISHGRASDAALYAVSYVDRQGNASGCAAAVNLADQAAMAIVGEAVEMWSRALRTRRALVAMESPDRCAESDSFSSMRAREFTARGDTVVQIGRSCRPLGNTIIVETVEDVDSLEDVDPDRLSFVVAPGLPVEDAAAVLAALRWRFPRLRGQHPDEWCYAASDRRVAVRSVAAASDLVLVLGEPDRPDLNELVRWLGTPVRRVRQISQADQLRADWLEPAATVGLVAAPSSGPELIDNVLEVLSGLGPLSVARRWVTTEVDGGIGVPVTTPRLAGVAG
jgi:4-hydroxy-3-methylbut-2-enyl diphosphate reductase